MKINRDFTLSQYTGFANMTWQHIVMILIGLTVGCSTQADVFLTGTSVKIFLLGLMSFVIATACGVLFAKFMNIFCKEENKINPLIGNAGVSAGILLSFLG